MRLLPCRFPKDHMGTQTNVKYSRISLPIAEALSALRDHAFDPLQIELRKFSRIQPTGEAEFPGYDAIGKLLKVISCCNGL